MWRILRCYWAARFKITQIESRINMKTTISAIRISEYARTLELKDCLWYKLATCVCSSLPLRKTWTGMVLSTIRTNNWSFYKPYMQSLAHERGEPAYPPIRSSIKSPSTLHLSTMVIDEHTVYGIRIGWSNYIIVGTLFRYLRWGKWFVIVAWQGHEPCINEAIVESWVSHLLCASHCSFPERIFKVCKCIEAPVALGLEITWWRYWSRYRGFIFVLYLMRAAAAWYPEHQSMVLRLRYENLDTRPLKDLTRSMHLDHQGTSCCQQWGCRESSVKILRVFYPVRLS